MTALLHKQTETTNTLHCSQGLFFTEITLGAVTGFNDTIVLQLSFCYIITLSSAQPNIYK